MVSVVLWIIMMIYFIKKNKHAFMSYIFSGLSWAFHSLGILLWIGITEIDFKSSCNSFPSDGSTPGTCLDISPKMGISDIIMIFLVMIMHFFVIYKATVLRKNPVTEDKPIKADLLDFDSSDEYLNDINHLNKPFK